MKLMPSVQSALSTRRAVLGEAVKSSSRASCGRTPATLVAMFSLVSNWRSAVLPLGSPMLPVAPPATAMGMCPASWKRRSVINGTRLPTCSESAVGSNPQ